MHLSGAGALKKALESSNVCVTQERRPELEQQSTDHVDMRCDEMKLHAVQAPRYLVSTTRQIIQRLLPNTKWHTDSSIQSLFALFQSQMRANKSSYSFPVQPS